MRTILILSTLCMAGCFGTTTVYVHTELPLPEPPVLPIVKGEEMMCLSERVYEDLVVRDTLRRRYAEECVAIIESHNRQK